MPPYNFRKAFNGKNAKHNRAVAGKITGSIVKSIAPLIAGGIAAKYGGPMAGAAVGTALRAGINSYPKSGFRRMSTRANASSMQANRISGKGDYVVGTGFKSHDRGYMSRHVPKVTEEKGMMCIEHTEYIGDLISSATANTFLAQAYGINAANEGTFPWLSQVAIQFQEYKFDKLLFEYRPLVSESSSSAAGNLLSMGSVQLATQYNSSVGPYPNKATMAESDFSVTCKPSDHAMHAVECEARYNPLGIFYNSAQTSLTVGANSSDIRMQNLGIFQIASSGIPTGGSALDLGEIWVHYKVKLFKPQLNAGLAAVQSSHYFGTAATGAPATTTPFGPNVVAAIQPVSAANNLLALTFSTTAFSFPLQVTDGQYLCVYYCKGSVATVGYTAPTVANGSLISAWNNGTTGSSQQFNQGTAPQTTETNVTNLIIAFIVSVNAPGSQLCTVTLNTTVVPTAGQFDLIVTPYNSIMA